MATNVNVNLTFTADTTAAKTQIKELQTTLNSLTSGSTVSQFGTQLSASMQQGIQTANQLKVAVMSAINPNTGTLDLSKFNSSLKQAGLSIKDVYNRLNSMGPAGQKVFSQLATSIQQSQVHLRSTNTALDKMWLTMKNTMKWQISATALRAFTSAIKGAFDYAQDLNESLNSIRIVTGQSIDEMAKFAEQANKAAKALSTSTTAYTDAALIYYQQGLKGKAVTERADTTVKLANVTRNNAQEVSQWMTAIWNNFDDGSKKLEYYADVITKLGATTASSSEEIATGLEKFSAVADTVGLSYEYATAALATVTAETRQSADVVGTAFKTLFARMQDLKLGETLEDGTTLGQYSAAMEQVGVDIKDASGQLKDMDVILDELGATWQTLDKDQQVALAKSVAGLRQYNQFIALMANYDTFKGLVQGAETASGTLQKQADVYAESWDGASKRVKASAESLYSALIDDDFFIGLTNGASEFIDIIKSVIDAMGGIKGFLPLLIVGFTKLFGDKMIASIRNFGQNLQLTSRQAQAEGLALKKQVSVLQSTNEGGTYTGLIDEKIASLKEKIYNTQHRLTEEEQRLVNVTFDELEGLKQIVAELEKEKQLTEEITSKSKKTIDKKLEEEGVSKEDKSIYDKGLKTQQKKLDQAADLENKLLTTSDNDEREKLFKQAQKKGLINKKQKMENYLDIDEATGQTKGIKKGKKSLVQKQVELSQKDMKKLVSGNKNLSKALKGTSKAQDELMTSMGKSAKVGKNLTSAYKGVEKAADKTDASLTKITKTPLSQTIMSSASAISSMAMGLSSLGAAWSTISQSVKEGNLSFSQLLSIFTSLTMGLPMLISGFSNLSKTQLASSIIDNMYIALAQKKHAAIISEILAKKGLNDTEKAELLSKKTGLTVDQATVAITKAKAAAKVGETGANVGNTTSIWAEFAAKVASLSIDWVKLAVTLLIIAAFVALVAIIIALVAAFKAYSDAQNADSIAAQKAEEEANRLSEALDKVKESYQALKDSIENYKEAQEAIKKLQEGTKEWSDAIEKSNENVLEMLKNYPELAKYISNDQGILTISDEGLSVVESKAKKQVSDLQKLSGAANIRAMTLRQKANETQLARNVASGTKFSEDEARNIINQVKNAYQKDGNSIFANTSTSKDIYTQMGLDKTDKKTQELIEGIDELIGSVDELNASIESQNSIDVLTSFQQFRDFNQEDFTGYNKKVSEDLYAQALEEAREDAKNLEFSKKWVDDGFGKYLGEGLAIGAGLSGGGLAVASTGGLGAPGAASAGAISYGLTRELYRGAFGAIDVEGEDLKSTLYDYLEANYAGIKLSDDTLSYDANDSSVNIEYTGEGDFDLEDIDISYESLREFAAQQSVDMAKIYNNYQQGVEYSKELNRNISRLKNKGKKVSAQEDAIAQFFETGSLEQLGDVALSRSELLNSDSIKEYAERTSQTIEAVTADLNAAYDQWIEIENKGLAAQQKMNELYSNKITSEASSLEMSERALKAYSNSLLDNSEYLENNKELAADIAGENYRLAKGIVGLKSTFKDWSKTLARGEKDTFDYYEAIGALQEQLIKTFGFEIRSEFVEEHLADIQDLANGSAEALKKLKKSLAEEFIVSLELDEQSTQAMLDSLKEFQDKYDKEFVIEGFVDIDTSGLIDELNKASLAGEMTADQMQSFFNTMDLSLPDTEITPVKIPSTNKTETHSIISTQTNGGTPVEEVVTTTSFNTSWTTVPWIGDNPPIYEAEYGDEGGGKVATGYKLKEGTGKSTGQTQLYSKGEKNSNLSALASYDGDDGEDKEKKDVKDEIERYHKISKELEILEKEYDRISAAKDRAFGSAKLALYDQEIAKQDEIIAKEKKYLKEIEANYKKDSGAILGYGAKLDENGVITNYEELVTKYVNKVNSGAITEEQYSDFQNALSQYEETLEAWYDKKQEIEDKEAENHQKRLDAIDYSVTYKIEISERDLAYIEHQLEAIEDKAYKAAEALTLMNKASQEYQKQGETYKEGITKILDEAGASQSQIQKFMNEGDFSILNNLKLDEADVEKLYEYADGLLEVNQNLRDNHADQLEKVAEAFENIGEEFDKCRLKLETLYATYDNVRNIADLIGNKNLGLDDKFYKTLNDSAIKTSQQMLQSTLDQKKATESALEKYKAGLASAKTEDEKKEWQDLIDIAEEKMQELEQQVADDTSTLLENVNQAFEDSMTAAAEAVDEALGGVYGSFEKLTQQFDKQKEISELYLQDYEKMYETSKMIRDIEKQKDTTDNIKAQRELAALQEEVAKFQADGAKMSQYDVEYLQKKYDLTMAQIALEEAQNAKSQVTLRRDSKGNYGYVYTADESKQQDAQANLEEAQYGMADWAYQSELALSEQRNQAIQNMMDELQEVRVQDYANEQEYYEARQQIIDHYTQITGYCYDTLNTLIQNNGDINKKFNTDMADSFNETLLGKMYPDMQNFVDLEYLEFDALNRYTVSSSQAYDDWKFDVERSLDLLGSSMHTFKDNVAGENGHLTKVDEKVEELGKDTKQLVKDTDKAFGDIVKKLSSHQSQYWTEIQEYMGYNNKLYTNIGKLIGQYDDLAAAALNAANAQSSSPVTGPSQSPVGGNNLTNKTPEKEEKDKKNFYDKVLSVNKTNNDRQYYVQLSNGSFYKREDLTRVNKDGKEWKQGVDDANSWYFKVKEGKANKAQSADEFISSQNLIPGTYDSAIQMYRLGNNLYYSSQLNRAITIGGKNYYQVKSGEKPGHWAVGTEVGFKGSDLYAQPYDSKGNAWTGKAAYYKPWWDEKGGDHFKIGYVTRAGGSWLYYCKEVNASGQELGGGAYFYADRLKAFDTGGYTGEWGSEGRWAMLHQKEIVLNAHDTENFLSAINILREMDNNLFTKQMSNLVSGLTNSVSHSISTIGDTNETKQDVYINADFSGVSSAAEIEEAFNNLINEAAQYVY